MSAAIVAFGAVSAMGEGEAAVSAGVIGERARVCIAHDERLATAGLQRPFAARVQAAEWMEQGDREIGRRNDSLPLPISPPSLFNPLPIDPATVILRRAMAGCIVELDRVLPGWRSLRIGLALGTSSGGMQSAEPLFARLAADAPLPPAYDVARALYFAPMLQVASAVGVDFSPATLVMGACAASTLAVGLGMRWLESDACDLALVGGFDAVSTLVAAGFEVLRATTASPPPRPFRLERDGMSLGEGAALVALRPARLAGAAKVFVTGFGASSDALHLTAPDRTGRGLARAATAALHEAGVTRLDLVSPHGSATPFSDAAEAHALAMALPDTARDVVLHPFKAQIGHTLGASGVLETLACVDALARGVYPAAAGEGALDPDAPATLLDVTREGSPATALKLSAAFGGANAALVLSREPVASSRPHRPVYLGAAVHVTTLPTPAALAERIAWPIERVIRAEPLARWVLASVAELVARGGALTGAGILVAESFATLETDASFHARIAARGTRMAEPRKFPYTSPNAAAGDAGVAFGLTGPSFAVGCGMHCGVEALAIAAELVASGDADALVVVAADEVGPTVARMAEAMGIEVAGGAVALVVSADPARAVAKVEKASCGLARAFEEVAYPRRVGHLSLLPLLAPEVPAMIAAASSDPRGLTTAWARVDLTPLHGFDAAPPAP